MPKKTTKKRVKKAAKIKKAPAKKAKKVSRPKASAVKASETKSYTHKDIMKWKPKAHPIERILKGIIILSVLGLVIAGYLIYLHYKPEASTICTFGEKLNCDVVNKSVYSKFLGIPNAIIGALGYIYFILVSVLILKGYDLSKIHPRLRAKHLNFLVILFAIIGWVFSMYLLYIETYVLFAYCVFCLASLAVISIIMVLSIFSYSHCFRCRKVMSRIHYKASGKMCRYC
ncbi:TPA: vitamin K epoxide reductase family protein [Candidatus Woesearchaeota archaeon]|nr:vitamin K epoxide reductase family protein [Candidatus Woesearchaeota archaeon]